MSSAPTKMTYRFLGNSGLLVSKLSLGTWMQRDEKHTVDAWFDMMTTAFKRGVNFYDTAEVYGSGQAEEVLGGAIKRGIAHKLWSREDLVISTKLYYGAKGVPQAGPNDIGLTRKHIVEGMKASLGRLELDYVDVLFCHRPDPHTPIEETVRAMDFVINKGWAFYWGTSEWLPSQIHEACEIADRLHLIRPIVEQSQYNIFERSRVEYAFVDLFKKYKLALTTWSPLAFGTLTGKYSAGTPEGSRFTTPMFKSGAFHDGFEEHVKLANQLKPIAEEIGCSLPQMSIAWAVSNENVSSVLVGASRPSQLEENLKALEFVDNITPEVKAKIDAIVNFVPTVPEIHPYAFARNRFLAVELEKTILGWVHRVEGGNILRKPTSEAEHHQPMTQSPKLVNPLGVNASSAGASKRQNESRKTQRMTAHSVSVTAARNNQILPARAMIREAEKATEQRDSLTLSFREAFGALGVPMLITLAACILWTTWLIVVALAPNEAANWLMGTGAYDNGHFWLIVDTNPTIINVGAAGLVFVDVCYLYVVVKMLRWRKTIADIQRSESWFEPESRVTPFPYPWMDTAHARCASFYTDLTSFRGSRRKFLNVCLKVFNLSMQMIVLLELLDSGNPATLVYGYTAFLSVGSLAGAVKILFGKFTAMGEIIAGSVFDLFAAVIHPVLVLEYCYYNFQFDDAVFATYMTILPPGSFERTARVFADASEIALFRLNFDSLRIRSVLDFVLRVGINLSFCYRIKRVGDVLLSIHLRRLQSVRIQRPKPIRIRQRPVPRVFATAFIAFSVFVWIFSSQAIKDTHRYCSKYPQCVVYAYRWGSQDGVCPCRILIDVDPAPKTYDEWIHPVDAYDAVQKLSLSGELRSLQLINRQLLELPEELRSCRHLTSIRLIYTSIQSIPSWAKEFKYLETLHVEGKHGSQNLVQLPEDLFGDMNWLSTVHIGAHRDLPTVPPLTGVPNLQSLTLAWLLSLRELPPFDHLPRLERLILTFLPHLERIPDMSPLESLSDFTLSRPVQLCCNGFRGSCNMSDNYCVENPIAAIPAATCLGKDPFLGNLGTEAAFDKFAASICQKLPSDLLLVAGSPTRQTIEICNSKPFGQCLLPSGGTGICYNTRMQVLSCYGDENYIKLRRYQIQLGVGSVCDPVVEKWLGCGG